MEPVSPLGLHPAHRIITTGDDASVYPLPIAEPEKNSLQKSKGQDLHVSERLKFAMCGGVHCQHAWSGQGLQSLCLDCCPAPQCSLFQSAREVMGASQQMHMARGSGARKTLSRRGPVPTSNIRVSWMQSRGEAAPFGCLKCVQVDVAPPTSTLPSHTHSLSGCETADRQPPRTMTIRTRAATLAAAQGVVLHRDYGNGTETRADKLARYRAKRARRSFAKTIRYETRRVYAEVRPRIKGRFVTPEELACHEAGGPPMQDPPAEGLDVAEPEELLHMVPTCFHGLEYA